MCSFIVKATTSTLIKDSGPGRRGGLQIFKNSTWEYHVVGSLPFESSKTSDPLSPETSLSLVLHNNEMVFYIDKDGHQISLATVSRTLISHVLSREASALGCSGKITGAVQDGVNNHVFISCTHRKSSLLQIVVGPDFMEVVSVFGGVHGNPGISPVLDGNRQYISAIDREKVYIVMIEVGDNRKLQTVTTESDLVKQQCEFATTGMDVKLYCVPRGGDRLGFISMQQLEEGNNKFFFADVKVPDDIDTVTTTSKRNVLILYSDKQAKVIEIDPASDSIIGDLSTPPESDHVSQLTMKFPVTEQPEVDTVVLPTTPINSEGSDCNGCDAVIGVSEFMDTAQLGQETNNVLVQLIECLLNAAKKLSKIAITTRDHDVDSKNSNLKLSRPCSSILQRRINYTLHTQSCNQLQSGVSNRG